MSLIITPNLLDHERRVAVMMQGFGQHIPIRPTVGLPSHRQARTAMLAEEIFEYADAAAVTITVRDKKTGLWIEVDLTPEREGAKIAKCFTTPGKQPDLVGMIDALTDNSVIGTGGFVACGVRMQSLLEMVDANNLMKIGNGRLDDSGKFIKPLNHPAPNIRHALLSQGWDESNEDRE